ncbi:Dynein light chain 1 [Diplonema papillatum]|nr:Dynein light chain 1 [Diplonema papillatum]
MGDRPEDHDDEDDGVAKKKRENRPVRKVCIKDTDMPPQLQTDVIEFIQEGLDDHKLPKDIARYVKTKLDETTNGTWHVLVGCHFACNATHDAGTLLNVLLDTTAILLFRNGPPQKTSA